MNNFAKHLLVPLVLLGSVYSTPSVACAALSEEGYANRRQQATEGFKELVVKVAEKADLIFVGHLSDFTFNDATITSPDKLPQIMRTHQTVFEGADALKGQYVKGQVLEYTINTSIVRISFGCFAEFWQFPEGNGAGERYLVYAQNGKILRTNRMQSRQQVLGGQEEAAYVRESVKLQ